MVMKLASKKSAFVTIAGLLGFVLSFEAYSLYQSGRSYARAKEFCDSVKRGTSLEETIVAAKNSPRFEAIRRYPDDLIVDFGKTCSCKISIFEDRAFPRGAWCAH